MQLNSLVINGGNSLNGELVLQGSKNGALPILAACVLVDGISVLHNCPKLTDVDAAIRILKHLGCKVQRKGETVTVDSRSISCYNITRQLMSEMRSSIVFLGALLSRFGFAGLFPPGGCEIGLRPIDLHISALKSMGAEIEISDGALLCRANGALKGATLSLSFPSVGATENIILASCLAKGQTTIFNAAREPEISDLVDFLNECGAKIRIEQQGTIVVNGVSSLHGTEHKIIPDRIVAITYMAAVAGCGGNVLIKRVNSSHFKCVTDIFKRAGCSVEEKENSLRICSDGVLSSGFDIRTMPYPGFPTDAQAPIMAMLCTARGTDVIVENIFENRFNHVPRLVSMGAKIKVEGRASIIQTARTLYAAPVCACDLRAGSALVVAALKAKGQSVISGIHHIDRGYEKIEQVLKSLGADIERSAEGAGQQKIKQT